LLRRVQKFEKLINDVFFVDFSDEIIGFEKRKLKFKNYLKNFISIKKSSHQISYKIHTSKFQKKNIYVEYSGS
jgi:hypothetical protein